jgi:enoyl-CoA hydratase/carnithine racemase
MTTTLTDVKLARISVEVEDSVSRIALRNPPLNVIDLPMMEELTRTLAEIEAQPAVTAIVFSGAGKAFSVGVDVAAHSPDIVEEMLAKFHAVIRALVATKKVTIAAVHGHCLGGGAEVAMVCDLVYTTALVGQKRAAELILTGRTINGREAVEIGLATRAVQENQLPTAVDECLGQLRTLSPAALAIAKKASYAWDSMHFDKGLARAEKIYFEDLMKTADTNEGIRAFMEKRPPRWTGK